MSLVHKALEKLPERQTADKNLPNPLQKSSSHGPKKAQPWRLILVVSLVLVVLLQAIFLYTTGTISKWFGTENQDIESPQLVIMVTPDETPLPAEPTSPIVSIVSPVDIAQAAPAVTVTEKPLTDGETVSAPTVSTDVVTSVITTQVSTLPSAVPVAIRTPTLSASVSEPAMGAQANSTVEIIQATDIAADNSPIISTTTTTATAAMPETTTAPSNTAAPTKTVNTMAAPLTLPPSEMAHTEEAPVVETQALSASTAMKSATALPEPIAASVTPQSADNQTTEQNNNTIAATTAKPTVGQPTVANASVSAKHSIQDAQRIIAAASVALEQGNPSAAENLLLEALAQEPNNIAMTLAFARFWVKIGDYDSAAGLLTQLQESEAVALRGLIHELNEQDAQAMALYQSLAAAQNLPSSYQLRYAVLLENNGNTGLARQWYQHYLTLPEQALAARQFAASRIQALISQ